MRKIIYNVVEKIIMTTKKYKFIKKRNATLALTIAGLMFAELFLTSMTSDDCTVYISVDGKVVETTAERNATIAMLFAEEGIILGEHDEVNLPLSETVTDNMEIAVDRVEYIDVSLSEAIAYETVYEESSLYKMGTEFLSQEGQIGCKVTTYTEKLVNGEVAESKVAHTQIYEPVNEIITVGTAHNEPYSKRLGDFELDNGVPTEYAYIVSGKVTAYTAPPGAGTYSGRKLEVGTVAVNPDIIPFGSELYICSKDGKRVYGYAVAADTGDLTEVVADVFMGLTSEHYGDACDWGAQFCDVYVLSVGDNSVSWR